MKEWLKWSLPLIIALGGGMLAQYVALQRSIAIMQERVNSLRGDLTVVQTVQRSDFLNAKQFDQYREYLERELDRIERSLNTLAQAHPAAALR